MVDTPKSPPTLDYLRQRRGEILALAQKYGAYDVRVFGSVARGTPTPASDVDLLVRYQPGTSLWDAVGLWQDLQELLGYEINLIGEDDTPHRASFIQRVRQEAVAL